MRKISMVSLTTSASDGLLVFTYFSFEYILSMKPNRPPEEVWYAYRSFDLLKFQLSQLHSQKNKMGHPVNYPDNSLWRNRS
jgi:hypothetical protein